jgi:hypothetical protein
MECLNGGQTMIDLPIGTKVKYKGKHGVIVEGNNTCENCILIDAHGHCTCEKFACIDYEREDNQDVKVLEVK